MSLNLLFENVEAVQAELAKDSQLSAYAASEGIETAGHLLGKRAEPDVDDFSAYPYWNYFKREFFDLLCTESAKYENTREQIRKSEKVTKTWFVPVLAAALGSEIGIPAAVASPFVALAILGCAKMGRNAWCAQQKENPDFLLPDGSPIN